MSKYALLLAMGILCFASQVGAQEGMTAYSAEIDQEVHVTILKVEKTRVSYSDLCTGLTGTYCGPSSTDPAQPRLL